MNYNPKSIRTFIGAKDFMESRKFYKLLGWEEVVISDTMVLVKASPDLAFYLQKYYVKKWVDNLMVFLEVDDVEACWADIDSRNLVDQFKNVRLSDIKTLEWGREFFLHDPSGVLWHFGIFNS